MKFIIAIEPGTDTTAWGVVVPDLPGCFSAGDSMDEALENAHEAIDLHVETLIEDGAAIPAPRPLAQHQADPAYAGWVWAVVEVPVEIMRVPDARHPGFAQECQRQSLLATQADAANPSLQPLMNAALAELAALTDTGQ